MSDPLSGFLELRNDLRTAPIGGGGVRTCAALTKTLDDALGELAGDLSGAGVALLATGGYGRREQCIYSDIDLTILHDGADQEELARRILYPLWDAGLKVGHAFRTVPESNAAGKERFDDLTSQLSARLIAGSDELFEGFVAGLRKNLARTAFTGELASLEAERRGRHPYQIMSPDVKKGRGALRTFHGFWWERRRAQLLDLDYDGETPEEREAFDSLLAIRNGLHARAGRPHDEFAFDTWEPVAEWLSSDVLTVTGRLTAALAMGDRLAELRWPGILEPPRRRPRLRRRTSKAERDQIGPLQTTVGLLDRPSQLADLIPQDTLGAWDTKERDAFVRLIGSGHRGRMAFIQLQEAGWVEREFPEWKPVIALPQLAPFHEHPADAHLWRTADEMGILLEDDDPLRSEIVASLGSDDELLLSAFLHDIGKGRGGDHSILGAEAAMGFLSRVGFGPKSVDAVARSIRHHLLLIRTATRRDIADLEVIDEVASAVGDIRMLQMLYLLTIADTKATGAQMWSDWKETLLTQLYMRTAERLTGQTTAVHARAEEIAELTETELSYQSVEDHLDKLPDDYRQIMSSAEIAWHLDNLGSLSEDHTSIAVDRAGRRVLAIGRDRRGFLLAVCRAFAAHGVGIHDARIYTRSDGIAIDTFDVLDDRNGRLVASEVWPKVAHTLEEIEASGLDVTPRVRHRAEAYDAGSLSGVSVAVRPDLSSRHLAIEVRSPDRVGLLADIVSVLYEEGLDLQLARIDTRGNEAIDVLYLERRSAPDSPEDLEGLCGRVAEAIAEGQTA